MCKKLTKCNEYRVGLMEDMMLNFDTTGSTIGPEPKKQKWEQHSGKTAAGTRGKMKY